MQWLKRTRELISHLWNSDIIHRNSQPTKSHIPYRQDRVGGVQKGGIMILVDHEIPSTRLDINILGLEFLTASISPTRTTKIVIVTLYRQSSTVSIECFIAMIEQLLSDTGIVACSNTSGRWFQWGFNEQHKQNQQLFRRQGIQSTDWATNYRLQLTTWPRIFQWTIAHSNWSVRHILFRSWLYNYCNTKKHIVLIRINIMYF